MLYGATILAESNKYSWRARAARLKVNVSWIDTWLPYRARQIKCKRVHRLMPLPPPLQSSLSDRLLRSMLFAGALVRHRRLLYVCFCGCDKGTFSISRIPIRRLALTRVQPTNYTVFRVRRGTCRQTHSTLAGDIPPIRPRITRSSTQQVNTTQPGHIIKHAGALHWLLNNSRRCQR